MRKLKVYGGNLDGVHRVIAATTSKAAFCKLTGCAPAYCCETGNTIELGVALNEPGVIFVKADRGWKSGYRRIGPEMNYAYLRILDQEERES